MPSGREIPPAGIPPAEVDITDGLVSQLLETQHPDLANLPLRLFGSGWDNTTYRLGEDLAVRLPRRELGARMMVKELRWLPEMEGALPLPIGAPVRKGLPEHGYPWHWSVVPWIPGRSAEQGEPRPDQARMMGEFLRALHRPAPGDAPRNGWRGVPLATRADSVEQRLDRIEPAAAGVPIGRLRDVWAAVRDVPIDCAETWLHGDLHPRNLIVANGRLEGVIDWGDLCVGDPATDLAAAWMHFPTGSHSEFFGAYGNVSEETSMRAQGWAIFFAVIMVDAGSKDDPLWAEAGRRTLARVAR